MSKAWNITADSTPDLDDWGIDDYWKIEDWIKWHGLMMQKYGRNHANSQFLNYWRQQTLGANPLDARTFNANFRAYAKKHGFFSDLYSTTGGFIARPLNWPSQVINTSSEVITSAADGVTTGSKILKFAIPAAVIIILAAGAFYLYQKVKK